MILTEEEFIQRRENYRSVFNNGAGTEVLTDILNICGYFNSAIEDERILVAKEIMYRMGINDPMDSDRMVEITGALLGLDPVNPLKKDTWEE